MSIISSLPRYTIEKNEDSVQVILPARQRFIFIIWNSLILLGYSVIYVVILVLGFEVYQLYEVARTIPSQLELASNFVLLGIVFSPFFLIYLALGPFILRNFFWSIAGKEIIEAGPSKITITRQIFTFQRTREYSASDVKNLRVRENGSSKAFRNLLGNNGMIAFDYGTKTLRFGADIEEAEARMILSTIEEGLAITNINRA